jgi:ATP-independent RNA helicase DbpA
MPIHPLNSIPIPPEPNDPVPVHDPKPARARYPTRRLTMSRLNCRIGSGDLRRYAPADCPPLNVMREIIVTAFSTLNVLPAAQLTNLNELGIFR